MAIANISFTEAKGSDFFLELIVEDADNVEDHLAYFRMADGPDSSGNAIITKNTTDPGDVIIHFGNRIVIHFESSETDYSSPIVAGQYYIEVTIENAGGLKKLAGQGIATFIDTNIKLGL